MRRLLTYLFIAVALVIFCAPCVQSYPNPTPQATHDCDAGSCALPGLPPTPEVREVISQDNWKFSTIGQGWKAVRPSTPEIKTVLNNQAQGCLVLFLKEETTDSFARYIIGTIRAFVANNDTISSIKQVVINDTKFVEVQINDDNATVWAWITVKDGFGYGFSCGGDFNPDAGAALHDLCQNIANTVEVK